MTAFLLLIFVLGYAAIAFEHVIDVNKSATALVTGVLCWVAYILMAPNPLFVSEELTHHLGELSGILFFLLGAMTIVELVDAHEGFDIITSRITQQNKRKLLWIIGFITFFLSAILDNLTTTIVMVSLLRKLIKNEKERLMFAGIVVIAANAGGAWSPIGDVTTTMLWMGGQITSLNIMAKLIVPSLVCLVLPLIVVSFQISGRLAPALKVESRLQQLSRRHKSIVFFAGITALIMVPVFKTVTHLPPYMGMLLALGILWIVTEIMHGKKELPARNALSVSQALRKIDIPSILFFLGILICIAALQSTGILVSVSNWMSATIQNSKVIAISIGLLSAIVDNVPLVAATQGMYSLAAYPTDHFFWEFLAYATGTGGSVLIIGSAAGVAAMGMERINFFWYLKKMSLPALAGYLAGCFVYILQSYLWG